MAIARSHDAHVPTFDLGVAAMLRALASATVPTPDQPDCLQLEFHGVLASRLTVYG